jgi:hypothetical protein
MAIAVLQSQVEIQEQQLSLKSTRTQVTNILVWISRLTRSLSAMVLLKKDTEAFFLAAIIVVAMIMSSCHAADGTN